MAMGITLFRLITASLLPVMITVFFYQMEKKKRFGGMSTTGKQMIVGVTFGIVAVLATEFGIPVDGAVLNVRNAAPLTAGLVFGWPAGILAGVIGSVERWFSNAGDYTRLACTLATLIAGLFGAAMRKFMMDDKKASWLYGLAIGVTIEVLHMLLVFLTNLTDLYRSIEIVEICAPPMIFFNSVSVMMSIVAVSVLSGKREAFRRPKSQKISHTFQRWLLICVIAAFGVTMLFTNSFQTNLAEATTANTLKTNIEDVKTDIRDASDAYLLHQAEMAYQALPEEIDTNSLRILALQYNLTDINLVDKNGIITVSTEPEFVGFDINSGEASAEFSVLLEGETEMVQDYQPTSYNPSISRKYAGIAMDDGGFIQVGYNAQRFQQQISQQVVSAAKNRHIGQDGSIIVCNEYGLIISDREGHEGENISIFGKGSQTDIREGETFTAVIYGEPSFCMYTEAEGYFIIGVMSQEEAMFTKTASVYILAFMEVIVFAALFAHIFFLIKILVVENIQKINASLAQITGGNLDVTVNVRSNEEFASLSDDINTTVVTLKHYIDEAAARIDKELEFAKQIQHSALPSVFPPYPHRRDFSIYASMDAAREVGGDFYDFYLLGENQLAFLIADVSGKGIPGAMFMMTSKTLIKSFAESGLPVNEVFTKVNEKLCENNEAGMFVTAWMGILDLQTGLVRYANAGHNPPVVKHRNGTYEYLKGRANFVLAGMDGIRYAEQQLQLLPGDEIYLYTDGVTEAHNTEKELFGEELLLTCLNETEGLTVDELCRKIKRDVEDFVGEAEQFDDITMLCVRMNVKEDGAFIAVEPNQSSIAQITAFMEEQTERMEIPMKTANKLMISVDEIYSNIVRYSGASSANLRFEKDGNTAILTFRDNGKPYNPLEAETPDTTLSAEERSIGGLGIFMVRQMMDTVDYEYTQGMNKLTLMLSL